MTDAPAEAATLRHRLGFALGPLLFLTLLLFPLPGLPLPAQRLCAVLALAIVFWVSEAIPMAATALLCPALCIPLGVASDREVLAPFAHPSIYLFLGSFLLAEAMRSHGLDRRIALWLLTRPVVLRTPFSLFAAIGVLTAALSMWMSNVATTAMMLPIARSVLQACPELATARNRTNLVLLVAFGASVGGLGTPVGTPPNIITMGFLKQLTGQPIQFFDWMQCAVPLVVLLTAFLLWLFRPHERAFGDVQSLRAVLGAQRQALGPVAPGERNAALVFGSALCLWMWPGLVDCGLALLQRLAPDAIAPDTARFWLGTAWLKAHLPEETVGLFAGLSLFLLPTDWRRWQFTLTWRQAAQIDWATILLFGGGLSLGTLIFQTKLAAALGDGITAWLGHPGLWTLIAVGIVASLVLSEAASNTASANVMVPLMLALAQQSDLPVAPVALATGIACSFGFLLPVSTGPNAMAYATGAVPITAMMRAGLWLDLVGGVAIWVLMRLLW